MDRTPKLQRKASLSLSTRLNIKRHSASPKNQYILSTSNVTNSSHELNSINDNIPRSPSVISVCSDAGIECTPPNKKMAVNLDDSLDFSPKMFDGNFSPTSLLSQTLAIDSPEVGWKWSRHSDKSSDLKCAIETSSIRTPDSAYAADSSFASAGSSSTEAAGCSRIKGNYKQRSANDARREDQRKLMEQELRRVENTRAEEMLKQRCAKLQEQLKSAGTQKEKKGSQSRVDSKRSRTTNSESNMSKMKGKICQSENVPAKPHIAERPDKSDIFNDFFNDSDTDCFLLEATQEIESRMEAKTQPVFVNFASTTQKSSTSSECSSIQHANSAPAATTTPPPNKNIVSKADATNIVNKDKRSSFYMKFLEDDCPDDWFVSLDEVILEATRNKKPRTSLQRYKSMPTETAGNSIALLNKKDKNDNCVLSAKSLPVEDTAASSSTFSKMKRHSSTHALSPVGSHYRSRRQL